MTRSEAINVLVRRDLAGLSPEEREALLLEWWSIDANEPEYSSLPELLKAKIARGDESDDPMSSFYDPLLEVALRRLYAGVVNSYLTSQVAMLGHHEAVDGDVEVLAMCPCCGYRTLRERGAYEICRVCFWEDDGTTELERVSGPNHMTLREARLNVQHIGAVTEAAQRHILRDGRERYAAGDV
jgi:hypothetical protein